MKFYRKSFTYINSNKRECDFFWMSRSWPPVGGTAEKRAVKSEYRDHVLKYVPVLRSYNMTKAANHLEAWARDELDLAPLLDTSAILGVTNYFSAFQEAFSYKRIGT